VAAGLGVVATAVVAAAAATRPIVTQRRRAMDGTVCPVHLLSSRATRRRLNGTSIITAPTNLHRFSTTIQRATASINAKQSVKQCIEREIHEFKQF
jgi:hypothetical protein